MILVAPVLNSLCITDSRCGSAQNRYTSLLPMSWALEILTKVEVNSGREPELVHKAIELGGRYHFREDRGGDEDHRFVTLTFEFENEAQADGAAEAFRAECEHIHVEGPYPYG